MGRETEEGIRRTKLVLLGLGGVGRMLLKQLMQHRSVHRDRYGLVLDIAAVADSSGFRTGDPFLDDTELAGLMRLKADGGAFAESPLQCDSDKLTLLLNQVGMDGTIIVDCTASALTGPVLLNALARGGKVVLANKKPLTGSRDLYRALTSAPGRIRWETTVASCLPVIAALNRILFSGDQVSRIAGTYSGTMGFLMSGLENGRAFSDLVGEAYRNGYTEPDPREDLAGTDVARKALILARGIGWDIDLSDIQVTGLIPDELLGISVPDFLTACKHLDPEFRDRSKCAAESAKTLRYLAYLENGNCSVGLREVPVDSPLGRLRGSDNLIEIETGIYSPNPLVLQGRGNGVAATASGIVSDIVELAFSGE